MTGNPIGYRPLREMAVVIRTKDVGINRLTYDIAFKTPQDYATAPRSNVVTKDYIVKTLLVDTDNVVGSFRVDSCNAIRISIDRPVIGAQQQAEFILMSVPLTPAPRTATPWSDAGTDREGVRRNWLLEAARRTLLVATLPVSP